ncbi:MAG: nitrophenyl compound nitroreductase subunit ArsF family protein [Candidatus Peribacteraceae bacterium]|nr:nitrophenyl compound nitroreductase subunit ArsF family protein [Candidatus Peribacteraceae bacterium]
MKILHLALFMPAALLLASCAASSADVSNAAKNSPAEVQSAKEPDCVPADKVIVANFHGTRRCVSCIAVGEMAQKTIVQEFPQEYRRGTIEFLSIDGERPENGDQVQKYQARGSSLYLNAIRNDQETIQEDVTVWRLVGNEEAYIRYLKEKISALLYCS